jgi:hypothetical protein
MLEQGRDLLHTNGMICKEESKRSAATAYEINPRQIYPVLQPVAFAPSNAASLSVRT